MKKTIYTAEEIFDIFDKLAKEAEKTAEKNDDTVDLLILEYPFISAKFNVSKFDDELEFIKKIKESELCCKEYEYTEACETTYIAAFDETTQIVHLFAIQETENRCIEYVCTAAEFLKEAEIFIAEAEKALTI